MTEKPAEEALKDVGLFLMRMIESKIVPEDGDDHRIILIEEVSLLSPIKEGLDLLNRQISPLGGIFSHPIF